MTITVDTTPRKPMYSIDSLAKYLALSTRTVRRKMEAGEFEVIDLGGGLIRITAESVEAYLDRCRRREPPRQVSRPG